MIVLADISGIQNYVFDVAEDGGGQARRLRSRSFSVQLLAEAAALRVRRTLGWGQKAVLLCSAGKFTLRGHCTDPGVELLASEQQVIGERLLRETRGELRLTLAWADGRGSDAGDYQAAQRDLQRWKLRPWAPVPGAAWSAAGLILDPLDTPCSLCHRAPGIEDEIDPDRNERRRVCRTCFQNREIGQKLPRARWLMIRDATDAADLDVLGLGIDVVMNDPDTEGSRALAVANLREPETRPPWCPSDRFVQRRLMAHVPTDDHGAPVWFTDLAKQSQGDPLLAVLKADADSLGVRFEHLLNSGGLDAMRELSDRLDEFFAGRLRRELAGRGSRWWPIYTIFAGGDDLIMVGPWNVMVDFAGAMRQWFAEAFRDHKLTLSAGLELMKPKRPIKPAVERAELLLETAKEGEKDQLAAFGQVWPWKDHDAIIGAARQLVAWENAGDIQRGWLHTLLELALARHGDNSDPLATARLAYHVDRNWKKDTPARQWADRLIADFDDRKQLQVHYLPAIVRYALTATRTRGEED